MESFVHSLVVLPGELKAALALAVLAAVRLALAGRVPDRIVTELATIISAALIAVIELALGLIPFEFEGIAAAVLQLLVVLLGGVTVLRVYFVVRHAAQVRGFRV